MVVDSSFQVRCAREKHETGLEPFETWSLRFRIITKASISTDASLLALVTYPRPPVILSPPPCLEFPLLGDLVATLKSSPPEGRAPRGEEEAVWRDAGRGREREIGRSTSTATGVGVATTMGWPRGFAGPRWAQVLDFPQVLGTSLFHQALCSKDLRRLDSPSFSIASLGDAVPCAPKHGTQRGRQCLTTPHLSAETGRTGGPASSHSRCQVLDGRSTTDPGPVTAAPAAGGTGAAVKAEAVTGLMGRTGGSPPVYICLYFFEMFICVF